VPPFAACDRRFPDPVGIALPKGERELPLARARVAARCRHRGIVKDAGDDPDVTHGALIMAEVRFGELEPASVSGGEGVGTVTKRASRWQSASPPSIRCRGG